MKEWLIGLLFGMALFLFGVVLMVLHLRAWSQRKDAGLSDDDHRHFRAQFRRRMQTSGMLAVLGVLVAVGDWLPLLKQNPALFGFYWIGVLLLTFWVILLAVGDVLSTRIHARSRMAEIRRKQRELEKEVARLRRRGSNGQDSS